jgi:enterochelin esterase-like enzyme
MLEPQSTGLFVLLVLIFGGLVWWLVVARRLAFRIVAACLAFLVAMQFGILAVNKYFGYYETWGAAIADFSNPSPNSGPEISESKLLLGVKHEAFGTHQVYLRLAIQQGYTTYITVTGSNISRDVYIFLPPQYFQPQYKNYKFPVIELIHGQPGEPQDWINVAGVEVTLDRLVSSGLAKPAVLVMPNANGGTTISLQCLNQAGGPQDLSYLAVDVPDVISHVVPRVQPPGIGWGVAGYSEGGFCAANMALRFRYRYGFAASMSGYFAPVQNKLSNPPRLVSPFANNAQRLENTPLWEVRQLGAGAKIPQFWLGAGEGDKVDVANAEYFAQELQVHEADVPLDLTPDGGHTMGTWHAEIPPMLAWMTNGLATAVAQQAARQAYLAHHPQAAHTPHPAKRHLVKKAGGSHAVKHHPVGGV